MFWMCKSHLLYLQRILAKEYSLYRSGLISDNEYLHRVKPIDQAIDSLEMATLQDIPVLKGSFSPYTQKQENEREKHDGVA